MFRSALIALFTALVLALPAVAQTSGNPYTAPSLAIAYKTWGGNMCGGQPQVLRTPLRPTQLGGVVSLGPFAAGAEGCIIYINSRLRFSPGTYCTVILHEGGHLAGRAHSSNSSSIMRPQLGSVDPRCYSVGREWSERFIG